jgi:hypothetical protein
MATAVARRDHALYDKDRQAWLKRQEELARAGRASELDLANIAEELREMGASERRELWSRLVTLMSHLLKYEFQPRSRSRSWLGTVAEQRREIRRLIEDSPSLGRYLEKVAVDPRCYADAVREAALQTGMDADAFPEACPHALERMLDHDFWPGGGPHPVLRARGKR